jgi:rhodanese-related sulfurtransferase
MSLPELSVADLNAQLQCRAPLTLLDVREANEVAFCALPGALHIPLAEIPLRLGEIPTDVPLVVYCHHGGRSRQAAQYLQAKGVPDVSNLTGGIHAWSTQIDPSVPTY